MEATVAAPFVPLSDAFVLPKVHGLQPVTQPQQTRTSSLSQTVNFLGTQDRFDMGQLAALRETINGGNNRLAHETLTFALPQENDQSTVISTD